jgi:hypothetical protein
MRGDTMARLNRFDYVKYDEQAAQKQDSFKRIMMMLEDHVDKHLVDSAHKLRVHEKLEEAYMWIGKAIRDEQVSRTRRVELQEERTDS